ncbi:MAG: hypothetical protein M3Q65_06395 [Chloroflexota bacterium]|nr:hypothetical protein [Chloroflexota bacterium]
MTCIVGLVEGDTVYIGGDSAGVAGYSLVVRADEKAFRNGPMLFGFTSSFRMGQLLRYAFNPPEYDDRKDLYGYMVTTFVDAVRDCLKAGGYAKKQSDQEEGGTFLVGFRGELFVVEGDYQVGRARDGYYAVGCGAEIALGSLHATAGYFPPLKRAEVALQAAERFSAGVRGPFVIEELSR